MGVETEKCEHETYRYYTSSNFSSEAREESMVFMCADCKQKIVRETRWSDWKLWEERGS